MKKPRRILTRQKQRKGASRKSHWCLCPCCCELRDRRKMYSFKSTRYKYRWYYLAEELNERIPYVDGTLGYKYNTFNIYCPMCDSLVETKKALTLFEQSQEYKDWIRFIAKETLSMLP